MKQTLLILLSYSFLAMYAQNPIRNILYTCAPDEDFFRSEFCSNIKIDSTKFACLLKNNKTNEMSFVWNGEKLDNADVIWVWYVDLNSKKGNVYECWKEISENEYEGFIVTGGNRFGPYENLYFADKGLYGIMLSDSKPVTRWGNPNLKIRYASNLFYYKKRKDKWWYRHDVDGSIYPIWIEDDRFFIESNPTFKSKNGQHVAKFSDNYRLLSFDGMNFILDVDLDKDMSASNKMNCFVTNSGICIVSDDRIGDFIIKNGEIEYFDYSKDHKYFDPVTESIMQGEIFTKSKGQFKVYDTEWFSDSELPIMEIYDSARKHLFYANYNNDYIMIDDKKIKSEVPVEAFYDDTNNAFGWVTIEGKSLVLYSYKL